MVIFFEIKILTCAVKPICHMLKAFIRVEGYMFLAV